MCARASVRASVPVCMGVCVYVRVYAYMWWACLCVRVSQKSTTQIASKHSPEDENHDKYAVEVETHSASPSDDDVAIAASVLVGVSREQDDIDDAKQQKEDHSSELLIRVVVSYLTTRWHRLGPNRSRCLSQPEDWTGIRRESHLCKVMEQHLYLGLSFRNRNASLY